MLLGAPVGPSLMSMLKVFTILKLTSISKIGGRPRPQVLDDIRQKLSTMGVFNVGQPISHRLDHLLSGIRADCH